MKAFLFIQRFSPLTRFILLGSLLELLYLLTLALTLLSTSVAHLILLPKSTNWPWILAPAQLLVHTTSSFDSRSANLGYHLLLPVLILIVLASIYLYAVRNAFHTTENIRITYRWLLLPVTGAAIFGITLLYLPPPFSSSANGYLFNGLALLTHLINCLLIWVILSKLAPSRRLGGTILYAWNPLVLIELVGNGHTDGFLICLLLLTILLFVQQKGRWYGFWAMVMLGCAISVNFMALLLTPLFIWFSVRYKTIEDTNGLQPDGGTSPFPPDREKSNQAFLIWECCWKALVALTVVFILYLPFWHGGSTFLAITSSFVMQQFMHSPLGILVLPVRWFYSLLAQAVNGTSTISSSYLQPDIAADMAVRASALFIFALIYFSLLGKIRSFDTLLTSSCLATLGFIVLVVGQFWPWYILWTIWIVALRRFDALTVSVLLLSCTALLTYPLLDIDNLPIAIYQPLLIFGIPLIYLITHLNRSNERKTLSYDRRSETAKN